MNIIAFAQKHGTLSIDADMTWTTGLSKAKAWSKTLERGKTIYYVLDMRFERTALYAYEHYFPITSSFGHLYDGTWSD